VISPIPHMFFYTFISMKEPLLGIDGMVCAAKLRGGRLITCQNFKLKIKLKFNFKYRSNS
jgi:hypothetical protein